MSIPRKTLVDKARSSANATSDLLLVASRQGIYRRPRSSASLTPSADAATRTYPARFSIEGTGNEVDLGMTATVTLTDASAAVARLPLGAILDEGHGPMVFVVMIPTSRRSPHAR